MDVDSRKRKPGDERKIKLIGLESFSLPWLVFATAHIPISPHPSQVAERLLDVFKKLHPTTFMIIDARVLKFNIASSLSAQSQLYSSYKTHNVTTLTSLICMTPDGGAALTSKSFTESTNDHELTIRSHYLDILPVAGYGTLIMADQGFDIWDLLMPYGVKLNIPPFKRSKQQMALEDVQKTQQIATF